MQFRLFLSRILLGVLLIPFTVVPNSYAQSAAVSATVPANASNFQFDFTKTTPGTTFAPGDIINYEITYGNKVSVASPVTLTATWTTGTIENSGGATQDILSYVLGSATNAYNATPPVIDTVNKKITWTIAQLPGNTIDQTVDFSLKTDSSYVNSNLVDFTVTAKMTAPGVALSDISVSSKLQPVAPSPTPTLTPTPGPTTPGATATPTPNTVTPTPTPIHILPQFTSVTIKSISDQGATIVSQTNTQVTSILHYGTSPANLSKTITNPLSVYSLFTLEKLTPDTSYFFKITAVAPSGQSTTSDIFTFKTAKKSQAPTVTLSSVIITANDVILKSPDSARGVVIPIGTEFTIRYGVSTRFPITKIRTFIENKNVLGISTFIPEVSAAGLESSMSEITPGTYLGRLKSPDTAGTYSIVAHIEDAAGNIVEQAITELVVVAPLNVINRDHSPIEHAKITLSTYNFTLKKYIPISSQQLPIHIPLYSEPDGTVMVVLPLGTYKATISAIGYATKSVTFTIAPQDSTNYPRVVLSKQTFSLFTIIEYLTSTFSDITYSLAQFVNVFAVSHRFFDIAAAGILVSFVLLTLLAFSAKTKIAIVALPIYISHALKHTTATE